MRNGSTTQQLRDIGGRITKAREALGVTQKEVCRLIGVGETTWNNWEKGKRRPDPIALARFCNAYGVTLDYIFRDNPQGLPGRILEKIIGRQAG